MRQNEINKFLEYLNSIWNNNQTLSAKEVYSLLVYYQGERLPINHLFENWIKYFQYRKNIKVFNDPGWAYFCQFINGNGNPSKMIKLYIPLSQAYIEEGGKIIFDFLEKNNIEHLSKIGSHLRNDNLVIRVNSMNDAKKIIAFVKNNDYLQKGLLPTNPFVFNQYGVGMAVDGCRSYNDEVSRLLFNFFAERRRYGLTNSPTANDFLNYLSLTIQKTHDKELINIYKLLYLKMRKRLFNIDDFEDIVNEYQGNLDLLVEGLMKTKMKYGNKQMMLALMGLLSDDFRYLTNDSNMRNEAKRYLSVSQVKSMVNRLCGCDRNNKLKKETVADSLIKIEELGNEIFYKHVTALKIAVMENKRKYNLDNAQINRLIEMFLLSNNFNLFTRENGARMMLQNIFVDASAVIEPIKKELNLPDNCDVRVVTDIIMEKELENQKGK